MLPDMQRTSRSLFLDLIIFPSWVCRRESSLTFVDTVSSLQSTNPAPSVHPTVVFSQSESISGLV